MQGLGFRVPAVCPRFLNFNHFDIQSTRDRNHLRPTISWMTRESEVTPAVYPHFLNFNHLDIQSTGDRNHLRQHVQKLRCPPWEQDVYKGQATTE